MTFLLAQSAPSLTQTGNESFMFWGIVLLGVSILLLAAELFVPSGGLIGALAAIALIGSAVAFFKYDQTWGIVASATYLILGPIIGIFGFKLWINSPLGKRMILGGDEEAEDEDLAISDAHARQERHAQMRQLIGATGVAVTALRPVGVVKINGQRVDALAETGIIDIGTPVVVTEVYDNQIKVRAAQP